MLLFGSLIDIKIKKVSNLPSGRNRSYFGVMIRITSGKKGSAENHL